MHTVFSLLVLHGCIVGNHLLGVWTSQWRKLFMWHYQDGMKQFSSVAQSCLTLCNPMDETVGTSFHHSGTSRNSGGYKGSSEKLWAFPYVTWLGPVSAHVVNTQPHAGAKDTDMSKTPMPLLQSSQVLEWASYAGRLFQPSAARILMVWAQTHHLCDV